MLVKPKEVVADINDLPLNELADQTSTAPQAIKPVGAHEAYVAELFGDKEVRWYQQAVRNQVRKALKEGYRNILIIQPTGTGKTISSAIILVDAEIREILGVIDRPIRVLFVSHRHRLLSQAEKTYADDESIEIITQSVQSPLDPAVKFDLIVFDEAHHEATLSFQMQLEGFSKAPMIGLTATPDRNDGRLCKFEFFIEPMTRQQAVEQGFLAETQIHSYVDSPDRSHVEIALDIVAWHGPTMGQSMVFARTKEDGQKLLAGIRALGYTAELLVDISEKELNKRLADFEAKKYKFCISCMKLGEGVDVKGCEEVLIARTLKSLGLLNQIIGRAARPDSICVVREIINPLAVDNISALDIVGAPQSHDFHYRVRGDWRSHSLKKAA